MARPKKKVEENEAAVESSLGISNTYNVKMWFIQDLLGSLPGEEDIYTTYIASKAPDAPTREEQLLTATVAEVAAKGVTVFRRRTKTGNVTLDAYPIKGFLKEKCGTYNSVKGARKITNHKKKIGNSTSISPSYLDIHIPDELIRDTTEEVFLKEGFGNAAAVRFPAEPGSNFRKIMLPIYSRPLRANTPQGEIVSIAASERVPAGSWIEFKYKINLLAENNKAVDGGGPIDDHLLALLMTGDENGTGQFRTSEKFGKFVCEVRDEEGNILVNNTERTVGCTSDDENFMEKLFEYIDDISL